MSELHTPRCGACQAWMVRDYNFASAKFKGSGFYSNDKKEDK